VIDLTHPTTLNPVGGRAELLGAIKTGVNDLKRMGCAVKPFEAC
jgi:hypothetical protein